MCFSSKVEQIEYKFQLQKLDKTKITDSIKYTLRCRLRDHLERSRPRLSEGGRAIVLVAVPGSFVAAARIRPSRTANNEALIMFPVSDLTQKNHADCKQGAWAKSPPGEQVSPCVVSGHAHVHWSVCTDSRRHTETPLDTHVHLSGALFQLFQQYSILQSHLNNFFTIFKIKFCLLSTRNHYAFTKAEKNISYYSHKNTVGEKQ